MDAQNNLYIADSYNNRIRKVDSTGTITTIVGSGDPGGGCSPCPSLFSGDGGPATQARLNSPWGVTVDSMGFIYIADTYNQRIRRVDTTGVINTVAGSGSNSCCSGEGGPATQASIGLPVSVAVDGSNNFFFADANRRVLKVNSSGILTRVAGNGGYDFSGDGGLATQASFRDPVGIVIDALGTLFIADRGNNRVRKVDASGMITTVAGDGSNSYSGDGGAATAAGLSAPWGIAVDSLGNLYFSDNSNDRIRRIQGSI